MNEGMRIANQRNGRVLAENAEVAGSFPARLVGLIRRRTFPKGSALVIPSCRQVHTFLMRFPIDVLFSDAQNRVVRIAECVRPCRVTGYCRSAARAIELPAGTVSSCGVAVGDTLRFLD